MQTIFVVAKDGTPLMPTTNLKKVRRLKKEGRAKTYRRDPYTIQLLYDSGKNTQPIEFCEDTGYQHIGISVKSEKHEYVSEERTLLKDEKQRHENQSREHRRPRRNRKRYRKARFDNRKRAKGWLAPSLKNKADRHVDLYKRYAAVCPITKVVLEMGSFDPQVLAAELEGKPIPEGTDYQKGPRFGYDTLRDAVFARDGHKCRFCGRGLDDGVILCIHHVGFWKDDRSNRMANLATACMDKCHVPKNHKPGGLLWGVEPKMGTLKAAAFMNTVRYYIFEQIKALGADVSITYGTVTKRERRNRNIKKSHANDAYCMGDYRPTHRCHTDYYEKRRRNNRILEKFYDAKYVDIRDGEVKKAAQLGTNRTNRREPRMSEKNERCFRGEKVSAGSRRIRNKRHPIQAGDIVYAKGYRTPCAGVQSGGESVLLFSKKTSPTGKAITASIKNVKVIHRIGGWAAVSQG